MSDTVISVENLGKKYFLSHQRQEPYLALRDVMAECVKNAARKIAAPFSSRRAGDGAPSREEFWALKNVSFDIQQGDRIGIIGRNGAGKSTLLKILSRITEPTEGRIRIRGRVASLLEVGTGFHPELTGRENVFLNGAVLGMTNTEIKRKFDEIVAFAEVEKFLDTPVKHYSSGMYVRLAFAVAAHLEPEILVVDEVLAVGDAQFQKKCLGKMENVSSREGRTVLFVSHNMGAISSLCSKSIYLKDGNINKFDVTESVIPLYLCSNIIMNKGLYINSYIKNGEIRSWAKGVEMAIEVSWDKYRFPPGWECDIACYTLDGAKVFAIQSQYLDGFTSEDSELNSITFFVENPGLAERDLRIDVGIRKGPHENYDIIINDGLILHPDPRDLQKYKRPDVIVVPKVSCKTAKMLHSNK